MPNKSRTQAVNKDAGKMRYTGYQVDKDGTEWVSQRDSANREWLTNQKTGETEMSKASREVTAARAPAGAVVRANRDFPDQDFAPSPDEGYRGEKKRGTKPDFPDQNLAPSPDEGYRGEKKMAKGGLVKSSASRRADGAAKKGKTKGRTL
jgi:hypothetical protein